MIIFRRFRATGCSWKKSILVLPTVFQVDKIFTAFLPNFFLFATILHVVVVWLGFCGRSTWLITRWIDSSTCITWFFCSINSAARDSSFNLFIFRISNGSSECTSASSTSSSSDWSKWPVVAELETSGNFFVKI